MTGRCMALSLVALLGGGCFLLACLLVPPPLRRDPGQPRAAGGEARER